MVTEARSPTPPHRAVMFLVLLPLTSTFLLCSSFEILPQTNEHVSSYRTRSMFDITYKSPSTMLNKLANLLRKSSGLEST
jgi:hypothetical protein